MRVTAEAVLGALVLIVRRPVPLTSWRLSIKISSTTVKSRSVPQVKLFLSFSILEAPIFGFLQPIAVQLHAFCIDDMILQNPALGRKTVQNSPSNMVPAVLKALLAM